MIEIDYHKIIIVINKETKHNKYYEKQQKI